MTSYTQIRSFRWEDIENFRRLFNDVSGITGTDKEYDPEYMRQFLSLPMCDPEDNCFVAEHDGRLVGFTLLSPEAPLDRVVASSGVLPSHRNRGTGPLLLGACIERARQLDVSLIHSETPAHNAASHHVLESEGFYPIKRFWQMRWQRDELPPLELPCGYSLRSFRLCEDEPILTTLQNEAFGQNWGFSPNTVDQIRARVRVNRCDPDGIVFIVKDDMVAGYNWTLRSGRTGWVSMTGVSSAYRGRGLGQAVVLAGIHYLRSQDVEAIELEVDYENTPARALYLKLGFEAASQTLWYEKRLK